MLRLLVILTLTSARCLGQTNTDYQLYSTVIDSFINKGIEINISTTEAVVIEKYAPEENEVSLLIKLLQDTSVNRVSKVLRYDPIKISLCKDENFKAALINLEKSFFETPSLEKDKFKIKATPKLITFEQFKELFNSSTKKTNAKGWKYFYKLYPGSHGIFEFSKIIYQGNFACFYVGRHSGGLSGSGDIIVLKKINDSWQLITYFNLWVS